MEKDRLFDAEGMSRRKFLEVMGAAGVSLAGYAFVAKRGVGCRAHCGQRDKAARGVFAYIRRVKGCFDQTLYQKVIGLQMPSRRETRPSGWGPIVKQRGKMPGLFWQTPGSRSSTSTLLLEDNLQKLRLTIDQAQYAKVKTGPWES